MRTLTLLIFTINLIAASCSSGKKQFEKGNYREAVHKAIKRLQNSAHNQKALTTLAQAYPMTIKYYQGQIARKMNSGDPHKWEWAVAHYQDLNHAYQAIRRSPAALRLIPDPRPFYRELEEAQLRVAELRYQWGVEALEQQTKPQARLAYEHFKVAREMVPDFRDVDQKMALARDRGTVKVLVDMVALPDGDYPLNADFFQESLHRSLAEYERGRFVDFSTYGDPREESHQWDHIIKVRFEDLVMGHTHTKHRQKEVSKDSVLIGSVVMDDGTEKEVYNTVYATLNLYKKEVISQGLVSMQVIDAGTGGILHYHEFPGSFSWYTEWGYFNGDRRALNKRQLALCARREELPPPPQILFQEVTKPIHHQMTASIRQMYGRF